MRLKVNLDNSIQDIDIDKVLKDSEIRFGSKYEKPQPLITYIDGVKEYDFINYGGMSAVLGRQKSRKTFYLTILMAAAVGDSIVDDRLRGYTYGKNHLWFDTEQRKYYCSKIPYRINSILNKRTHPDNFNMYSIKRYTTEDRIKIIEDRIHNTKNIGLVIIDGLRDIVKNFNDLDEVTEVMNLMMNWNDTTDCHLCLALHINPLKKGDEEKPRGHLGTELQNKVESSVIIEKNQINKNISTIKPRDFRDIDIDSMDLTIDGHGIPHLIDHIDENQF